MNDLFSVVNIGAADADKIEQHLAAIKESQAASADAFDAVNKASTEFNKFYLSYGQPYFKAKTLDRNDTPRSEVYNENLTTLSDDINRVYVSLDAVANTTLNAFNFATVVSQEITNSADASASKVLDLNILNGFTKGQVIVAGDDFSDTTKIDNAASLQTSQAKPIQGAKSYGLSIIGSVDLDTANAKISVTPIKPVGPNGKVTTDPTPLNLERFYEGKFYAFVGQQQPEGGMFTFKYVVDPSLIPSTASVTTENGKVISSTNSLADTQKDAHFLAVVPASEEAKASIRAKMFDGNADTYWQCEYVYQTEPLIDPNDAGSTDLEQTTTSTDLSSSAGVVTDSSQVVIDLKAAEEIAKKYDYQGRDLQINIDVDFGSVTPVNYVLINPVVAGTSAFIKVLDVATADASSDFKTVDGFSSQAFDKILTPEANKTLNIDVQAKSMAPSAFSYAGLGVFSFPVRFASRLRVTLLAEDPIPAPYERMHVLVQETGTLTTTVTKKKSGFFGIGGSKKKTKYVTTTTDTNVVKLSYLQTLALSQNLLDVKSLETDGVTGQNVSSSSSSSSSLVGKVLNNVFFGGLFSGLFGTKVSKSSTFDSTGIKVKDQWLQPYFDRIRYTIGVRELSIAKYTFSERSELVSVPFLSPKEVIKIYAMVDEYIPPSFDAHTNWIQYFVKAEGFDDWIEIAPSNLPTRFNDQGEIIPKIINFNVPKPAIVATEYKFNYTSDPVQKLRFRAVFSRPVGGDFDSITPLLKSYRLIMVPRG